MSIKQSDKIQNILTEKVFFQLDNGPLLKEIESIKPLEIFDESIISFLDSFSKNLLHDKYVRNFPDIITLGFWCRKASIEKMRKDYNNHQLRIGRGIAFHIAPSNVAVNFAYSMIASMLAGNINIVRLPSKQFEQVDIIVNALKKTLDNFISLKSYLYLVRYKRNQELNDYFSQICDLRIIWGGNSTIRALRTSEIQPRTKEICFADRYSICVIQADIFLGLENKDEIATSFYNDTYLNDQNACTSPKLIVWMGQEVKHAKFIFWSAVEKVVKERYNIKAVQVVDKLEATLHYAGLADDAVKPIYSKIDSENMINCVTIQKIEEDLLDVGCNSGLFFEYQTDSLEDILPICNKRVQTIATIGITKENIETFILQNRPKGIDRVVPVGKTLDFSLIWDGYDLLGEMSRIISVDI